MHACTHARTHTHTHTHTHACMHTHMRTHAHTHTHPSGSTIWTDNHDNYVSEQGVTSTLRASQHWHQGKGKKKYKSSAKTYPTLFYDIKGPWGVFVYHFNSIGMSWMVSHIFCLMYGLHGVRCSFQGSWYMHVMSTGVQLYRWWLICYVCQVCGCYLAVCALFW